MPFKQGLRRLFFIPLLTVIASALVIGLDLLSRRLRPLASLLLVAALLILSTLSLTVYLVGAFYV